MNANLQFDFTVDKENNKINVIREFAAPLQKVWSAWTKPELLDQWWAPKPYKVSTKSMDFRNGGRWHYAMVSPEGDKHWCLADYDNIEPEITYSALDAFCDENGNINTDFPRSHWKNDFTAKGDSTLINITITYKKPEDLERIIELGFKEGFAMALGNLDEWFSSGK